LGVDQLRLYLRRHQFIGIDTSIFIYQVEARKPYVELADAVFSWLERGGHRAAVTSTITMTEVLVPSYKQGDDRTVDLFYSLLSTYPNLRWLAPDLETADLAARIRGVHRLRTPDALQAATALQAGATGFVTNDAVFTRIAELETAVLDEYI
jgi:predicted nucleic acid-binding protein